MQGYEIQQSIFVTTGMHRSGTSLTASLLQSAGVDVGKRLMGASPWNVNGHFENLDFVEFHQDILYSQGISEKGWTLEKSIQVQEQYWERAKFIVKQNSLKENWGWKDPRTTLFLDFWASFLPNANFLLVYRAPWEVVDSLYRRGDDIFFSNPSFAIKIWLNYNQALLNFYNKVPERCILFNISSIIKDPSVLVKRIKEKFGSSLSFPVNDIYDNSLFRTQDSTSHRLAIIEHYFREAVDLYNELNTRVLLQDEDSELSCFEVPKLSNYQVWALQDWLALRKLEREQSFLKTQQEQFQAQLQQSQSQLQQTQAQLQQTQAQLQQTQAQLQQTQAQLQQTQAQLQQTQAQRQQADTRITAMESSKFWKLRKAWHRLKPLMGLKSNE